MKWLFFSFLAVFISLLFIRRTNNNVCKTFEDYYTNRDENQNCYYNPDYQLEVPGIVRRNGYPLEQYDITTKDGYIIKLFRIPHGKVLSNSTVRKPIFLQHGMTLNSGIFVNVGKKSLAYILADAGYDVWLGNFRGSLYGDRHVSLTKDDIAFWDYTFHENGLYDLPVQIDFVYKTTKQKLIFLGYSLGSTAAYIYSSTFPTMAKQKLEIMINFAPSIFFEGGGLLLDLIGKFWFLLEFPTQLVSRGRLYVRHPIPYSLVQLLCLPFPFQMKMCQIMEMCTLGFNFAQNDPETLPITLVHNTDTASVKTITHFAQISLSHRFQHFDYGPERNMELYGEPEPLVYNLSDIRVPTYTFFAQNDLSVSEASIKRLYALLPKETTKHGIYTIEDKNFNHLNFITAKDIIPLVYEHLLAFLRKL